MAQRKIEQIIVVTPHPQHHLHPPGNVLYALCADGVVWSKVDIVGHPWVYVGEAPHQPSMNNQHD